jgi:major membrane immunogen (membrane-anchored lipoprotein)
MRFVLTMLTLSLLLTACGRRDIKFGRQITGTWTNGSGRNIETISSNGSFALTIGTINDRVTYQGTWLIKDGEFVTTVTNAQVTGNYKAGPVGAVSRVKIVKLADHQFFYEYRGQKIELIR